MRRLSFAGLVLLSCGRGDPETKPIAWMTDLEAAERKAAATQKPVLVFVGAEWDTGTKEFEDRTFRDEDVQKLAEGYVPFHVDGTDDENPTVRRLADRFHVLGIPTLIVLAPDFHTEIHRMNSFVPPDHLASVLRYTGRPRDLRDLRARAWYELYRHLIDTVRERVLTHPLLDPAPVTPWRNCWAEANSAKESCLRDEEARTKQWNDEQRLLEHDVVPSLIAGTPILGVKIERYRSNGATHGVSVEPTRPEQDVGTRNADVGIRVDDRTTLGWGHYRTAHHAEGGSVRGDTELHPGIEVAWQDGGDSLAVVLLTDGFRRPSDWR